MCMFAVLQPPHAPWQLMLVDLCCAMYYADVSCGTPARHHGAAGELGVSRPTSAPALKQPTKAEHTAAQKVQSIPASMQIGCTEVQAKQEAAVVAATCAAFNSINKSRIAQRMQQLQARSPTTAARNSKIGTSSATTAAPQVASNTSSNITQQTWQQRMPGTTSTTVAAGCGSSTLCASTSSTSLQPQAVDDEHKHTAVLQGLLSIISSEHAAAVGQLRDAALTAMGPNRVEEVRKAVAAAQQQAKSVSR